MTPVICDHAIKLNSYLKKCDNFMNIYFNVLNTISVLITQMIVLINDEKTYLHKYTSF